MPESTRSRTNNSETIVHEEIINLIDSPELREHLLHNPQFLSGDHYTQIIGGASIEINRKREMLSRLVAAERGSSDKTFDWYGPERCIDYIDDCLGALKAVDGNKKMLLVSEISFVNSKVGSAITHGPFPVASWPAALAAMKTYADKWSGMTDLSSSYWMIELFNLANDPSCSYPYDGFLQPDYTYYANTSGEIQYICREEEGECGEVLDCIVGGIFGPWFKGAYVDLPTPYKKGDILEIDCRPWAPGPCYCLVANSKLDCLYPDGDGQIRCGSIPYGSCFAGWAYTNLMLSPVFRARKATQPLPEEYAFLQAIEPNQIDNLLEECASSKEEEPIWLDIYRHRAR
ncbi:hypothetical protein ACTQX9_01010 [Collinsella sp. LCP19S3_F2]|uniref:hypothetical protein n=1 Tax=Collinsella sp. LCP19S3_F2 TaxID=3438765 RepID=UPI003F8DE429